MSVYIESGHEISNFLIQAKSSVGSWENLSKKAPVSSRTLRHWYNGKSYISLNVLELLSDQLKIALPPYKLVDFLDQKRIAGKKGGLARVALYGNPGTIAGRLRGGLQSIKVQAKNPASPFVQKKIAIPAYSSKLAEFVGILLGDGHVDERQISISIGGDEFEYTKYISDLSFKLFNYRPSIKKKKGVEMYTMVFSRTALVDYIKGIGLIDHHKVRSQSEVPLWVQSSKSYSKACLRGLFDTDGSFFIDRHLIKKSLYYNPGVAFTNYSLPILNFFYSTLVVLGFHPTISNNRNVLLRRVSEVHLFFKVIKSNNPKHLGKFKGFVDNYKKGKVPKRL